MQLINSHYHFIGSSCFAKIKKLSTFDKHIERSLFQLFFCEMILDIYPNNLFIIKNIVDNIYLYILPTECILSELKIVKTYLREQFNIVYYD